MSVFDRYRRWIDDYLDGELDTQHAESLKRHLETCGSCQADFAQKRRLKQRLQPTQQSQTAVPQSLQSKLLAAKTMAPEHHYDWVEPHRQSRAFAPIMACMTALVLLTGALFAAWSVGGSSPDAQAALPQETDSWSNSPRELSTTDIASLRREGWNLASLDYVGLRFDSAHARAVGDTFEVVMNFVRDATPTSAAAAVSVTEQRSRETALESASLEAADRPGSRVASADEDPHPLRIMRTLDVPAAHYQVDVTLADGSTSSQGSSVNSEAAALASRVLDRIKTTDQARLQFVEGGTDPWDRVVDGLRRLVGVS